MILITGATGNFGTELTKQLAAQGIPFRALVRTPKHIEGATTVIGDLGDKKSLIKALEGVEKAFLLTHSSEEAEQLQSNFVDAAVAAGVKHIVKLSQFAAAKNSPLRFMRYHAAIEEKIIQSGIAYTFLRPNLFMQGLLGFADLIKHTRQFYAAIGDAAISAVDVRDIAAVATIALSQPGHENKIYDLTGPAAITHAQMAQYLSAATGQSISFVDVPAQAMRPGLIQAGFPEWQADGLLEDYAHYARGEAALVSTVIEDVTGRPPGDFASFARDYAPVFK
ncbi:SDR family oxidoreductase [Chitinophaga sp.]|uniref:SDR family oxidoreductase n=1 Tax=Chitinophaga sp. TaxID=1869181 RepID=UPI0031D190A7